MTYIGGAPFELGGKSLSMYRKLLEIVGGDPIGNVKLEICTIRLKIFEKLL